METIPENIIEKIWKETAGFSPDRASREMTRMGKEQPELLAFLMGFTDDLDQEAQELSIYLAFVVFRIFQTSSARIKRISQKEIIGSYNRNEGLLKSTEEATGKFPAMIAGIVLPPQPHVMQYVIDALTEEPEEHDLKPLGNEDKLLLFLLLKTVVELLDKNAQAKS
jgi:hypothetical protein